VHNLERQTKHASTSSKSSRRSITVWPFYMLLAVLFALYLFYQGNQVFSVVFGTATFLVLISVIVLELFVGMQEEGYVKNILEIAAAIIAVVVLWLVLRAVLQTQNPIDVVPSCSMLPALQRGDMVVLRGVSNISQIHAPMANITEGQFTNLLNSIRNGSLSCVAYTIANNRIKISQIVYPGYTVGLYKQQSQGYIVPDDAQANNTIKYTCGIVNSRFSNGTTFSEASTTSIKIGTETITGDKNNSIIVYETIPGDLFYTEGDLYIVHRAYAVLNVQGSYYILTKGDNNPGLDIQYSNYPANLSHVEGRVISSIPYVGYLKLLLSGSLHQPTGCNSTIES